MPEQDIARSAEGAMVATTTAPPADHVGWVAHAIIEKYWGDDREAEPHPYETIDGGYNLLTTNGANTLLNAIVAAIGTPYNATNARIGVGTGTTTATAADTDLTSGKVLQVVNSIPTVATNVLTAVATFATGSANQAWNEWGLFNSATAGTGMLNHAVPAGGLGTKTSASAWTITITITLS